MANTNRNKGHDAERLYVKKFKELGFEFCQTSRYASRMHDDNKIDLVGIPYNVQIKAGAQRGMNPSKVLGDMKECVSMNFPPDAPEHNRLKVLIHRKEAGRGKKRNEFHDLVTLTWDDFKELLNKIH